MATKNKLWFGEQVLLELQSGHRNSDEKIDIREAILRIDAIVNYKAKLGFFDNWKLGDGALSEHYITTWENVTVVDQANKQLSYLELPSSGYIDLPKQQGIVEIYPMKYYLAGNNHSVIIMTHSEWRQYNSTMAASMQGRLSGYPQGTRFIFTEADVKKVHGNMGVRLAIRDSSVLSDTDQYPIPADKEHEVIMEAVQWFRDRKRQPADVIRDGNDKP